MTDHSSDSASPTRPDLDWSQVRETVRMLFLSVAQIDIALHESNGSVGHLTDAFSNMMSHVNELSMKLNELPQLDQPEGLLDSLKSNSEMVSHEMQAAIVALQFYDKLTQRLSHVASSLEALSELVGDTGKLYNPYEWKRLQAQIKSRYSMSEERDLFDSVMRGDEVREAIRKYNEKHKQPPADQIEFF